MPPRTAAETPRLWDAPPTVLELDQLPGSARACIERGEIEGAQVRITLEPQAGWAELPVYLAVCFEDQHVDVYPLPAQTGAAARCATLAEPAASAAVVTQMKVLLLEPEGLRQLPMAADACVLGQLLCQSQDEINARLRWSQRIAHFGTRVFVAKNSYRHLWQNPEAAAYCLVSVGYTSLEREDAALSHWISGELRSAIEARLPAMGPEARISMLCHALHHAVAQADAAWFEQLLMLALAQLPELESVPHAAQNIMVSCFLGGLFYAQAGLGARAAEILVECDRILKIAVARYPRKPLNVYLELEAISHRAFKARVLAHTAQGLKLPARMEQDDPLLLGASACRLRGKQERRRFGRQLQQLALTAKAQ